MYDVVYMNVIPPHALQHTATHYVGIMYYNHLQDAYCVPDLVYIHDAIYICLHDAVYVYHIHDVVQCIRSVE